MIAALVSLCLTVSVPNAGNELPDVDDIADAMTTIQKKLTHAEARTIAGAALEAGVAHEINPLFLLGVAFAESRWVAKVRPGDSGRSFGIFQMTFAVGKRVNFGGLFENELEFCGDRNKRKLMRWALEDVLNACHVAAAYIAHLRRKYGKRKGVHDVMVIYNCGPTRCKQSDGTQRRATPATRAYWRAYRKLRNEVKRVESMKPDGNKGKDA